MKNGKTKFISLLGSILTVSIAPAFACDWMGESGGTYQTIGSVRYSGWSGKAIRQSTAIL